MEKQKWILDGTHSEITFKVKHMMITNVSGSFNTFGAELDSTDDSFKDTKVSFWAETKSIDTNNSQRDEHLRGDDFFESEKYPMLRFESESFDASTGKVDGNLTIKDVTKAVTFDVEFGWIGKDPWWNEKSWFTISGKINRKERWLGRNAALETGGVVVSDEVKINCEAQFVKQA